MAKRRSGVPDPGAAAAAALTTGGGFFNTAGGFLIGALLDVLLIQYIRGGGAQVRAWLKAKFINDAATAGTAGKGIGATAGAVGEAMAAGVGAGAAGAAGGSTR